MLNPFKNNYKNIGKGIKYFYLLALLLSNLPFLFGAREKGSSRLKFASYNVVSNNSIFLQDDKFPVIYSNFNTPASLGFFDLTYQNRLVFGIDRNLISIGSASASLPNSIFKAE